VAWLFAVHLLPGPLRECVGAAGQCEETIGQPTAPACWGVVAVGFQWIGLCHLFLGFIGAKGKRVTRCCQLAGSRAVEPVGRRYSLPILNENIVEIWSNAAGLAREFSLGRHLFGGVIDGRIYSNVVIVGLGPSIYRFAHKIGGWV
jgi:hypothetical protein